MAEAARVSCGVALLHEPLAVLAAAPDAYIAIDTAGRVVGWNPAAEATFGHHHAHACGRDLAELIIPTRYRSARRAGLARLNAGGPGRVLGERLQLDALHADGHEMPLELTLTVTAGPAGPLVHAFCHGVTAARRVSRFGPPVASSEESTLRTGIDLPLSGP